ncbi:conserved hypothetical protein [Ricinus communis]|uniref:MADS-box domain-containing protein n=1 Tax=Ricinus communis TaxID=3988 RepID=B9SSK9_RICCO|nr:conserved hypothetical protein [Ricinus communis]
MGRVKLPIKRIENNTNRQYYIVEGTIEEEELTKLSGYPSKGKKKRFQYLLTTLKKLKTENDMALQAANPDATRSNVEELQHEVCNLQHQVQIAEDQLRIYEPDPSNFTSMGELESCEKNLLDVMARIEDRKKYLLSSHASTYDPSTAQIYIDAQEGLPNFQNEIANWLPDNGQNPNSIGIKSESCIPLSNQSSTTMFDALSHEANVNVDGCNMGASQMNNQNCETMPSWHQAFSSFSSTELLAAFMPPNSFPLMKHEMEGPSFTSMLQQQQQAEPTPNCPQMICSGEDSNYENYEGNKLPQFNVESHLHDDC